MTNENGEIIVEITQEEYEEQIAEGLDCDEIMGPGIHIFRRIPRNKLASEADLHPSNTTIYRSSDSEK